MTARSAFALAISAFLFAGAACAQQGSHPLPLHDVNFDMWCQEIQHLPPSRCDERLAKDDKAFEAYTTKIQYYESDYLRRRAEQRHIDRHILHYDPVDNPQQISTPTTVHGTGGN